MEKNISKSKGLVISVCALLIILACSMLLTACHTVYLFHELAYHGYSIRTIIYTDDVAKYAAGRQRVYELELSSSSSLTFEDDHHNWLLATDREYVYDLIINTNEIMSNGEEGVPFSYGAEMYYLYTTGNYAQYTAFDNSYLFSGIDGRYMAGGPIECEDKRCNCGFLYDDFDNCCQCDKNNSYNISNSEKLTEEQVRDIVYNQSWGDLDIYCEACYTVDEYENSDGTYNYYFHNSCTHKAELVHDGTFSRPLTSWMQLFRENTLLSFKFKELIIDGYDFSILYDSLSNYDYSKKYFNWESYPDFNNFSHMFSDLPVEKIIIKRVSGLGDKAVDLSSMFENCINLRTVEFGNLFEGCKPKNISRMFYNCPNLKEVDLTSLDTSETTNMSEMFSVGTSSITFDERKAMVEEYINTVLVEEENLDPTVTYTVESYAEHNNVSEEEVYLGLLYTKRLRYPATYDEACRYVYGAGFCRFCKSCYGESRISRI